jgi:hypothetical protein
MQFFSSRSAIFATLLLCGTLAIGGCTTSKPSSQSAESKVTEPKTTDSKLASDSGASSGTPAFNLTDRRVIDQYNDKFMPEFEKKITENCKGAIVKIKIDWNSFGNGDEGSKAVEAMTNSNAINRSVDSVVNALKNICNDDAGRKAVTEKLKTLNVSHVKDAAEPKFNVENGTMTLLLNVAKGDSPWVQDMQGAIEKTL